MAKLEYEATLKCSVEGLFNYLAQPANVALLSRPELGIAFTSAPDVVQQGSRLDFQLVTFGQVVRATHEIVAFDFPKLVIERQITGPLKSWIHRHEYEAVPQGVRKRDVIEFELPGGLIGLLLSASKIKEHLKEGLCYRDRRLVELIQQGQIA